MVKSPCIGMLSGIHSQSSQRYLLILYLRELPRCSWILRTSLFLIFLKTQFIILEDFASVTWKWISFTSTLIIITWISGRLCYCVKSMMAVAFKSCSEKIASPESLKRELLRSIPKVNRPEKSLICRESLFDEFISRRVFWISTSILEIMRSVRSKE